MKIHGMYGTRLNQCWNSMLKRCRGTASKKHKALYHDRGITVCDEWQTFEPFMNWALNNGYTDKLTIDRKDNNGPYSPKNCQWSTMTEQANNRRGNRVIECNGKTMTIAQWSRKTGLKQSCIQERLRRGWDEISAITKPVARILS